MKRHVRMILFWLAAALFAAGCGNSNKGSFQMQEGSYYDPSGQSTEDTVSDLESENEAELTELSTQDIYYMVLQQDTQNQNMILMNLSDGSQAQYEYTEGTEFFDKYGQYTNEDKFTAGSLIQVQRFNRNGTLGAVSFTRDTWTYQNVRKFSVEQEKNAITLAGARYSYDQTKLKVFSNGTPVTIYDIGKNDVLTVYGIDKQVYSIVIDTGHGTLQLKNTSLFVGGWLNLGTQVYAMITDNMSLDVPEGTYELSVANNGYGDSGEVRIRRGKVTTIDLNDYKGEGPKMGELKFNMDVPGASVYIDGQKVDTAQAASLSYGVHKISISAEGYDTWTKQLVVNSPTTKIDIALSDSSGSSDAASSSKSKKKKADSDSDSSDSDSESSSSKNSSKAGTQAGSKAGSLAGTHSGSSSSSSSNNKSALSDAALDSSIASIITGGDSTDYLDTLSNLVDSLEKLDRLNSRDDSEE